MQRTPSGGPPMGDVRQHTEAVATIHTAQHIEALKAIAANYAVPVEDIIAVPNVKEWSQSNSLEEKNPCRVAKVVQNTQTRAFLIILAAEITDSMQRSVTGAMELRGFVDEVEALRDPTKFLQHLVLHELAHPLHPGGTESDCDAWAFKELGRYAA